jgi:Na+-transporting methylmalonyl-CoA/oxaloacetate decarboxylase beta subunit
MVKKKQTSPEQKKSKRIWLYLFGAIAAYGAAKLINLFVNVVPIHKESASIGIIGGADGPTAIFVTSRFPGEHILTALLIIAGIWGFLRLCKWKK